MTGFWISLAEPAKLYTGLTGVLRSHRRRGIATALKVTALEMAKARGVRTLETDNEENNPMYLLNVELGFEPTRCRGDQWCGRCPLPGCPPSRNPSFSVNVSMGRYYCHRCHRYGHQIELWAAATGLPLYPAAIDLCAALGQEVPWIQRW